MNHIHNVKEIQDSPDFQIITTDQELLMLCRYVAQKSVIALDTEFIRIRTFYPQLGLIQLYDGEKVSLIDPLEIKDFSPFVKLLANPQIIKVLHASSEDLEVFLHYFNQLPTPMVDTQIMANFLSFPNSTGLATLIHHYFQLEIDKGASRTDWLARPLSTKQLEYAAADVWYLLPLYHVMWNALQETPWQQALQEDCALLLEKKVQFKSPELAYLNISNAWRLNPEELMRLKLLAKWRQEEAIKRNLALNFVIKSDNLWAVAKYNPKHTSELLEIGLTSQEVRIHGKKLLQLLTQMKRIAPSEYPPVIQRLVDEPRYKKAIKSLQQKLKEITPEGLNSEVITSKQGLEQLLKWYWLGEQSEQNLPELLIGWRKPFGKQLLETLEN
ncbi:ribonuclease D [[Haemophilus] felis]|uniref:Ribonuclease D n=1 Tax=[Haemophilus] felis TaxID=123822 RepID=A0A1T0ASY8_9PAST|nr:ribonuclease D [[Haemophilus] felis]NBI41040.1 ribonuclease D [[Haemophilus] felis]OOR99545.1 ribonuclease D [[Haemophilus] felis]